MPFVDLREQARRRSPKELVQHLKNFKLNLKFSAGIWYFSPPDSRFHDKYKKELNIKARLDIAEKLIDYGLTGLEAHYPNEINEKNLELWKKFLKSTGMKLVTIVPLLFRDRNFEFGSLSNPIEKNRRQAIELTKRALELNKELNTDFAVIWPGIDGYENPFGIDFFQMWDRFAYGLAEAMDRVPGVRIAFEPKPYEPRGRILFGTTPEGLLLCHKVESLLRNEKNLKILKQGHKLCCMNPEIGHALMAYEDLAYAYSLPLSEGRLAHMHLNSQPLGNFDQDLNVGVVSPEQLEALLYVLKMHSYNGWFGIDINPERMDVQTAIKISIDAIRASNDRINELDHESIVYAVNHPDKARGWIEAYLVRMRAPSPERLPRLPSLKKE
ncbi:MAG: TIM barrel protein [candidate division WOR-3 bacterium]|nr:TIM barrel protein [candidate division WOR-3 bacterium]